MVQNLQDPKTSIARILGLFDDILFPGSTHHSRHLVFVIFRNDIFLSYILIVKLISS